MKTTILGPCGKLPFWDPARRCRASPQGRAAQGRPGRAPGGRPGTSEPGPKMVLFRMVPKWSFSFFGYILYYFKKDHG